MYSGNFLEIQNNTGNTVVYQGVSYQNSHYVPIGNLGKYAVTDCKLWGSDTGRSMTGSNQGTLIGIFPKLSITLMPMSEDDFNTIVKLMDQASTNVRYYDAYSKAKVTNSFYFGDVAWEIIEANTMKFGEATISVIANERRS